MHDVHEQKVAQYTAIGYQVVTENECSTLLSYYPYSASFVQLVRIEDGTLKSSIKLTASQVKELIKPLT